MRDNSGRNWLATLVMAVSIIGICAWILLYKLRGCGGVLEMLTGN